MGAGIFGVLAVLALIIAGIVWLLISLTSVVTGLATCFVFVCALMMLIILIQKPKGGGLSGAFGGAGGGSSQAAFGAKTGDVLTVATITLFVLFLGLAMGMVWASHDEQNAAQATISETTTETETTDDSLPVSDPEGLTTTIPVVEPDGTDTTDPAAEPADDETSEAETPAESTAESSEPNS